MAEPLFTVESTFRVFGRGLALIGFLAEQYESVKNADVVMIQRPDGSIVRAAVCGVEYPPSSRWIAEQPIYPRYGVIVDLDEVPIGSIVTIEQEEFSLGHE